MQLQLTQKYDFQLQQPNSVRNTSPDFQYFKQTQKYLTQTNVVQNQQNQQYFSQVKDKYPLQIQKQIEDEPEISESDIEILKQKISNTKLILNDKYVQELDMEEKLASIVNNIERQQFQLGQDKQKLIEQINELKQTKNSKLYEIEFMVKEIQEKKQQQKFNEETQKQIIQEYQTLQIEFQNIKRRYEDSNSDLRQKMSEYQFLKEQNQQISQNMIDYQNQNWNFNQIQEQEQELKEYLNSFLIEKNFLVEELQQIKKNIENQNQQKQNEAIHLQTFKKEIFDKSASLREYYTNQIRINEKQIEQLQQQRDLDQQNQSEHINLFQELEKKQLDLQMYEINLQNLNSQIEKATDKFKIDQNDYNIQILKNQKELEKIKHFIDENQQQNENQENFQIQIQNEITQHQKLIEKTKDRNSLLKEEKIQALTRKTELENELKFKQNNNYLQQELNDKIIQLDKIKLQANMISISINELRRTKQAAEVKLKNQSEQIKQFQEEIINMNQNEQNLEFQLQQHNSHSQFSNSPNHNSSDTYNQNQDLIQDIEELNTKILEMSLQFNSNDDAIQKNKKDIDHLMIQIQQEQIKNLNFEKKIHENNN